MYVKRPSAACCLNRVKKQHGKVETTRGQFLYQEYEALKGTVAGLQRPVLTRSCGRLEVKSQGWLNI